MSIQTSLVSIRQARASDKIIASLPILDNQYVDYNTYSKLEKRSLKSIRDNIASGGKLDTVSDNYYRELDFEYKKSLIFSNEILANRAYFINSLPLIMPILSGDEDEKEAFAEMMDQHMISSIMYKENETDFADMLTKDIAQFEYVKEEKIHQYYQSLHSKIKCYSMAYDEGTRRDIQSIATRFRTGIFNFDFMEPKDKDREMRSLADTLQRMIPDPLNTKLFIEKLQHLQQDYELRTQNRNEVYKRHICQNGTRVPDGKYQISPEVYALKLWVDSMYNENMPLYNGYRTIVPRKFPTAYELKVNFADRPVASDISNDSLDERIERMSMGINHNLKNVASHEIAYEIPFDQLGLSDIVKIKKTEAWAIFISALNQYMFGNISIPDFLEKYKQLSHYIHNYVAKKNISLKINRAIPVAIDRILVTTGRVVSVLCIVHSLRGGIEGAYLMDQLVDLNDIITLLHQAGAAEHTVALKKGIDMIAVEGVERITNAAISVKQRFEFLWEELNHQKLERYIKALERVNISGRVTGESDKME